MLPKLNVTISKTAQGIGEYLQITSDDATTVNVVLIAATIEIKDVRPPPDTRGTEGE